MTVKCDGNVYHIDVDLQILLIKLLEEFSGRFSIDV